MKPLLVDVSDSRSMRHNDRHLVSSVSSGDIDDVAQISLSSPPPPLHSPHFILLL